VFLDANGNPYFRGNVIIGRRNIEGGGRRDDLQHTDYRIVAGMRGDLGGGFSYDVSYQYGRVIFAQTYFNDFSITRLARALDVVNVNGVPTCSSVINGQDPNCVPYDIFTQGGVTPAALNYLQTPGFSRGNTQETVINASLTAQLGEYGLQSPIANHGVAINVGGEYRKEKLEFNVDQAFATGDLAGQGGATLPVNGQFHVKEFFSEIQIPIVEDRPFFQQLEVRGGYRYSKYSIGSGGFSTNTTTRSSSSSSTMPYRRASVRSPTSWSATALARPFVLQNRTNATSEKSKRLSPATTSRSSPPRPTKARSPIAPKRSSSLVVPSSWTTMPGGAHARKAGANFAFVTRCTSSTSRTSAIRSRIQSTIGRPPTSRSGFGRSFVSG
jgi:hypothetical protein